MTNEGVTLLKSPERICAHRNRTRSSGRTSRGPKAELATVLNSSKLLLLLDEAVAKQNVGVFVLLVANGANVAHTSPMFDGEAVEDIVRSRASLNERYYAMALFLDFVYFCHQEPVDAVWIDASGTLGGHVEPGGGEIRNVLAFLADWKRPWKLPLDLKSQHRRIHLFSNNGAIILALFLLLESVEARGPSLQLTTAFLGAFAPPGIVPGYRELFYRNPSYRKDASTELETLVRSNHSDSTEEYNSKTMTFERGGWMQRARLHGHRRLRRYRSARTPHLPRTLDENYYPGLGKSDFSYRNTDQVVTKEPWRRARVSTSSAFKDGSYYAGELILVVSQLWVWKVHGTVISAYPISDGSFGYTFDSDTKRWRPHHDHEEPAELCIARMLRKHVQAFELSRTIQGCKTRPLLDIFESYVVLIVSEVDRYTKYTRSSEFNLETERRLLHDVTDVQEELVMITSVLNQQSDVLHSVAESLNRPDANEDAKDEIELSIQMLGAYQSRIKKIQSDAERIEKSVKDMLELKRAHASVTDAHHSLLLSTAVMGFTVVTIIFAPLAFLTALFALKLDSFGALYVNAADGSRIDGVYDGGKLGGILVSGVVLTFIIPGLAVLAALWMLEKQARIIETQTVRPGPKMPPTDTKVSLETSKV
ncbi:uncharacterized protein AB675_8277 [Cyphellophora attinorum]|uniref:Uncharacterized protein n=1 Tax=Cyphellophora attinorum TaxID=1664694 RepID=A0A0N1P3T8_9EURO|nr:uncharacterized protein AB675_8277 [Phialophora attinorum]KPI44502.1 hypothetical protein AB675_8277 [Phialophora attinorum]